MAVHAVLEYNHNLSSTCSRGNLGSFDAIQHSVSTASFSANARWSSLEPEEQEITRRETATRVCNVGMAGASCVYDRGWT